MERVTTRHSSRRLRPLEDGDPTTPPPREATERLLIGLEVVLSLSAFGGAAGVAFGGILGDTVERLPFGSARFAGAALALVNGVWPVAVAVGSLRRQEWATWGHLTVGVALMGWIVVQVSFLGPPIVGLQIFYFILGATIAGLAWLLVRQRRP